MKIITDGNKLSQYVELISLTGLEAASMTPQEKKDKDGKTVGMKTRIDGKPLYSLSGVKVLTKDFETKAFREERNTYVSVVEPQDVEPLKKYRLEGLIVVESFSGRDGLLTTIHADKIIPLGENK